MKLEDDDIISLNWDLFDKHITKCKKCQKIQQEYQKLQIDSSLKQQEINLEREQNRAVAIGRT